MVGIDYERRKGAAFAPSQLFIEVIL